MKTDHHLTRLPDGRTLFRARIPTPDGPRNIALSLGRVDRAFARRARDAILRSIDAARLAAHLSLENPPLDPTAQALGLTDLLERLRLLRRRQAPATLGQLITAYEADAPGRALKARSAYQAIASLRIILRALHPGMTNTEIDALPASTLTAELLEDYKNAKLRASRDLGPSAQASTQATIASTARQAQSLLAREALAQAHLRELTLPDLTPFTKWKSGFSTRRLRQELDDNTLSRLAATVEDLWFNDPPAWLAICLAGNLGLRRGEATRARWSWIRLIAGVPTIYIVRTDDSAPKGNERRLTIDPTVYADMCAHRATSDYILPGATLTDRDAIYDRTKTILRAHGLPAGKPNHELRALQLQRAQRQGGMDNAQRVAGHSDRSTTEIYTGRGTGQTVRVL
jgi:integrase